MSTAQRKEQWQRVPLGDYVDLITGFPFKSQQFTQESEDIPLVKGENVHQGFIDWEKARRWDAADFSKYEKFQLQEDDVVLAMDRPWIEAGLKYAWIKERDPKALLVQRVARIRGINGLSTKYVRYIIASPQFTDYIKPIVTGVNVPHISGQQIKDFKFLLPPLSIQHRIAAILSAYDDLIEINARRIRILEEMARRIYEEWFVRFHFPGHANVKMVESELGMIPNGWGVSKLDDLLEHHVGGGWGEEEPSNEFCIPAFVIRGTDIPNVRLGTLGKAPIRYHKESNFKSRKLENSDIVFEVSGGSKDQPVGRAVLVREQFLKREEYPVICASFCRLIRANKREILPELLLLHLQRIYNNREIMKYQTQSTGITNFKFTVFLENEKLLSIPPELQRQYADIALPLYHLAANLGIKNENLRRTRDFLLPKLISGEIDVSNFPESMSD